MPTPEEEIQAERTKRTRLLLIGGAASLALPLLGVVYLRMSESKTSRPPDASVTFDRREKGDEKMISLSQTITVNSQAAPMPAGPSSLPVAGGLTAAPAPGSGSSLDFVKGGANNTYFQDNKPAAPAAPAASTAPAAAAPAAAPPEPETKTAAAKKGGKKPFVMPKLNGTKSLQGSGFKSGSQKGAPGAAGAPGAPGAGGADMAEMLKKVPGANSNPELQKYLNKGK